MEVKLQWKKIVFDENINKKKRIFYEKVCVFNRNQSHNFYVGLMNFLTKNWKTF